MKKDNGNQFSDIITKIRDISINKDTRISKHGKNPISDDEIYSKIMSSSFKRISSSQESTTFFLKRVGILDKDGHLTPEYK